MGDRTGVINRDGTAVNTASTLAEMLIERHVGAAILSRAAE